MPTRTRAPRRRRNLAPVAFVAPFLLLFLLTFAAPIGYAVFQSVMDVERTGPLGLGVSRTVFVGLSNYSEALSDHAFLRSIGRVLLFAAVQVPVMVVPGR